MNADECVFRVQIYMCTYVCSRVHMCVPIGHVFAFQENTRFLSDEHTDVCSGRTCM